MALEGRARAAACGDGCGVVLIRGESVLWVCVWGKWVRVGVCVCVFMRVVIDLVRKWRQIKSAKANVAYVGVDLWPFGGVIGNKISTDGRRYII